MSRWTLSPDKTTRVFWGVVFFSLIAQGLIAFWGAKAPSTDVFVFKEAGTNFALTGKFAAMNLPHMQPEEERVFSYYPPAYPFLFGLWSKVTGVGLTQSNLFDLAWRLLRTGLLFLWILNRRSTNVMALGLLGVLSVLSTDADRPDEMALTFALAAWWSLGRAPFSVMGPLLAGLALGICGAASPAAGVFGGVGLAVILRQQWGVSWSSLWRLTVSGALAAMVFFGQTVPVLLADRLAYYRFSRQLPMSTFPYLEPLVNGEGWRKSVQYFVTYTSAWFSVAIPYVFAAGVAGVGAAIAYSGMTAGERRRIGWCFPLGALFCALVLFVWTRQPYYLWFPTIAFFAVILASSSRAAWALSLGVLALLPLLSREAKWMVNAAQIPAEEQPAAIRERVLAHVGPYERLAVTPDQYFTFRPYREIANIRYMCDRLDAFDYVYVTRILSSKREDGPIPIPCESPLPRCFVPVSDFSTRRELTVLGFSTDRFVRGAGGTLYQNRRCTYSLKRLSLR